MPVDGHDCSRSVTAFSLASDYIYCILPPEFYAKVFLFVFRLDLLLFFINFPASFVLFFLAVYSICFS